MFKGQRAPFDLARLDPAVPTRLYTYPNGEIWVGEAIAWLSSLESECANLVFADPPYNIKKAEWDSFESQAKYVEWSLKWIEQAARVLKPTGTLYICGFSEILADLGSDWGRSHESLLHFRKSRKFTSNVDDGALPMAITP